MTPFKLIVGLILVFLCLCWFVYEVINSPIIDQEDEHERKVIADMKRRDAA